jgi:hypothetical protein
VAAPQHGDGGGLADAIAREQAQQRLRIADGRPAEPDDDVADEKARAIGGCVAADADDDQPHGLGAAVALTLGEPNGLARDPEKPSLDAAVLLNRVHDRSKIRRADRERRRADQASRGNRREPAVGQQHGAAGDTGVDADVETEQLIDGAAGGDPNRSVDACDRRQTGAHVAVPRASDDQGQRAGSRQRLGVGQRVISKARHPQQHEVRLRVAAGNLGRKDATVRRAHSRVVVPLDRVARGDDPVWRDEKAAGRAAGAAEDLDDRVGRRGHDIRGRSRQFGKGGD